MSGSTYTQSKALVFAFEHGKPCGKNQLRALQTTISRAAHGCHHTPPSTNPIPLQLDTDTQVSLLFVCDLGVSLDVSRQQRTRLEAPYEMESPYVVGKIAR